MKSISKQIRDTLQNAGFKCYFPTQHKGECTEKHIVIKEDGVIPTNVSSERPIYTIMCYVPQNNYSCLSEMCYYTKKAMKQMFPLVMYLQGSETPSFYDDEKKAHMISFQYLGCRKIESW